ncbi:MAG: Cu(I)-responsive transcriptional regulator [Halobacteriovoraceae bacterium]|nr:Cu(I)-responsive transcriptional regulator [Halobacteriovoraceae bacterium]
MNIGEAAEQSGISSKMIRKYEDSGLIPKARRSDAGYRTYSENDIHTFRFIKTARSLGFSLKDIKELLSLWKNKKRASSKVKKIAEKHIENLEIKSSEINTMLKTLKHLTQNCHGDDRPDCPILSNLESSVIFQK